ncbi:MAG: hypothetical protein KJ709_04850 [Nanoarchaeota archaeon]|nr:hypothetical protein [Nanoarchaeota archaeon]
MSKVFKEVPLAEITLRKYEKPHGLSGRDLYKKLCLSFGLLQPGDSRDVIVDILRVLVAASRQKNMLSSEEVKAQVVKLREEGKLPLLGVASSNIRRQLRRLRDLFIVEKIKNEYRITEFLTLQEIFKDKIEKHLLPDLVERLNDYLAEADATNPGSS